MPISHWCRAATVHTASRCSFGIGVSSKSAMAPPDSSKIHAAIDDQPEVPYSGCAREYLLQPMGVFANWMTV